MKSYKFHFNKYSFFLKKKKQQINFKKNNLLNTINLIIITWNSYVFNSLIIKNVINISYKLNIDTIFYLFYFI